MGRSCSELLEPNRYQADIDNFLLSQVRLVFPDDPSDEPGQFACGLLDLSATPMASAALAMHAAAILEGSTSRHPLAAARALDAATRLARARGADALNLVVAAPADAAASLLSPATERLPGAWIAVADREAQIPRDAFDVVVTTRRNPTLDSWRVFRMLASLLAKDTVNCMDLEDFVQPLKAGATCHLLDAFVLPGSSEVQLVTAEDETLLRRAAGIVIVQQLVLGEFGLRRSKGLVNSVRDRAPQDIPLTFHWPLGQRADVLLGPVQQVDILVAL
jgi:hypothetical protein